MKQNLSIYIYIYIYILAKSQNCMTTQPIVQRPVSLPKKLNFWHCRQKICANTEGKPFWYCLTLFDFLVFPKIFCRGLRVKNLSILTDKWQLNVFSSHNIVFNVKLVKRPAQKKQSIILSYSFIWKF